MSDSLGFFGGMDAAEIGTDPFYITPDWYLALCTDAKVAQLDNGNKQLRLTWQIDDQESEFFGKKKMQSFKLFDFPAKKAEAEAYWAALDQNDKMAVQSMNKTLVDGFGFGVKEVAKVNTKDLVGRQAYIKIVDRQGTGEHAGKTFNNLVEVMHPELFQDKHGSNGSEATSASGFGI